MLSYVLLYIIVGLLTLAIDVYGLTFDCVFFVVAHVAAWPYRVLIEIYDLYHIYKERRTRNAG